MTKTWKEILVDCGWPEELIKDWTEEQCEAEYRFASNNDIYERKEKNE